MSSRSRCVVLGANGFIGSHVVDALLAQGHDVRALVRQQSDMQNLAAAVGGVELQRGDFFNADDLGRALTGMDCVVHLVSTTIPASSNEDMANDVRTNVMGHIRMLDVARQVGVRKIIFASSGGTVYGLPQTVPIRETHPTSPICSHGIAKRAGEMYLHLYHHLYGLDYAVLRFANPYGPRQNPLSGQGAIATFLRCCLTGEPISIWGDGSVARDFVYIGDLVRAVVAAVEKETPAKIYNIGSGAARSLNQVLDIARSVSGRTPDVRYLPGRNFDVPVNFLDISRARRELAWQPQISIEDGLERTWEDLRRYAAK